ncbi:YihY/virulence factor BrkB family protein [Caenimonas terrae]|uniref:YihY/virulence factor BrkB family protein n=1 Tax=Caenimonas terrae TaxID=696074 RepID=A0ABW0NAH2_9BURK
MHAKNIFSLFRKAGAAWIDDFAPSMGAAISYYTVFSLAPLLVIVIAVAGAVFGREAVTGQIVGQLSGLIGKDGAQVVQGLVAAASDTHRGLVASLISAVILLVGATTVFAELQSALDRIWHVPPAARPSGIVALLRTRLVSFGLILGVAFLLMVSLSVSAGLAALGTWAGSVVQGWELMLQALNALISLSIATLLFAMIFKLMPSTHIAWRDVWMGAGVTAVLFEAGKLLIGLYLGKGSLTESFAAAGSLVVLLAWVYYAAQIFLLGAEFTKVYADEHGSLAGAKAMQKTEQTAVEGKPVEVPKTGPSVPGTQAPPGQQVELAGAAQSAAAVQSPAGALAAKQSVVAGKGSVAGSAAAQSVDVGKPVMASSAGGTPVVAVPVAPIGQKAIDMEMETTKKAIITQLVSLAAIALLDAAVSKYQKRVDQRISVSFNSRRLTPRVRRR